MRKKKKRLFLPMERKKNREKEMKKKKILNTSTTTVMKVKHSKIKRITIWTISFLSISKPMQARITSMITKIMFIKILIEISTEINPSPSMIMSLGLRGRRF